MKPAPVLHAEREHGVMTITLNRPAKRNALSPALMDALAEAFARADSDPEVRAVIVLGEGPAFCAGMDLAAFRDGFRPDVDGPGFPFRAVPAKPVIAAVDGPAVAGGLELVLACDIVVATPRATFGLPEVRLGLVAAGGGMFRLPLRCGGAAMEMLLTGDPVTAEEAHRLGVVHRVVEAGEHAAEAGRIAQRIAAVSPSAVGATLEVARAALRVTERALWQATAEHWARIVDGDDAHEGVAAFLTHRTSGFAPPDTRAEGRFRS
jgi:enoyl-CoA hydratase